jgi:hypothetical protein
MPSINVDLDYFDHPKVIRLVGLLGKGAEVLPLRLWCYAGKYHAEDGKLIGYSAQEIEASIKWWGKVGDCTAAMVRVVLLDAIEGGFQVHDWAHHAGHIASYRRKGKEMAAKRWANKEGYWNPNDAASNAAFNTVSMLLAFLTAMPINYALLIESNKDPIKYESSPKNAHGHPLYLALKAAKQRDGQTPAFPRFRWAALENGFEPPEKVADTIAAVDSLIAIYSLADVVAAFMASMPGRVSIAEARGDATRGLAKAHPEKAAQQAKSTQPRAEIDYSQIQIED